MCVYKELKKKRPSMNSRESVDGENELGGGGWKEEKDRENVTII